MQGKYASFCTGDRWSLAIFLRVFNRPKGEKTKGVVIQNCPTRSLYALELEL